MKKTLSLLFVLSAFAGIAQQDLQFTQFMFNKLYYNPGVAGSGDAICINAFHRSQWVGFEGAPTSQNLTANIPISKIKGGLGVRIANDQIGFFQNLNFGLGYGYQRALGNGTLGIGASLDIYTNNVSNADWRPPQEQQQDFLIPQENTNGVAFDASFGLYYESERIWAGVSSMRLIESASEFDNSLSSITKYYNQRHYYLMGGYNWPIPASNWELRPSLLIKTDFAASPIYDIDAMGVYNNKLWGGVSFRVSNQFSINPHIGYQITESLGAGYSYDIGIAETEAQGGGSHEIFVKYCFKIEIPPRVKGSNKNPRFL